MKMKSISAETVKRIFGQALEKPAGERPAFLDSVCGSDATLRGEVQALLAAFEDAGEFMASREAPNGAGDSSAAATPAWQPEFQGNPSGRLPTAETAAVHAEPVRLQEG